MTIRDAIYLILVFVLNDDNEISLAFEIGTDSFLFQKPMKSRCRHSKQIPVSGKLHPDSHSEKIGKIVEKLCLFFAFSMLFMTKK